MKPTTNNLYPRRYSVMLYKRTDCEYERAVLDAIDVYHPRLVPCVRDVSGWIAAMFPWLEIDTKRETMRDMMEGARIYGLFSISLRKPGDPQEISYKLSFLEV